MQELDILKVDADLMREIVNMQTAAFDEWRHGWEERSGRELLWVESLMAFHNVHRRIVMEVIERVPDGGELAGADPVMVPALQELVIQMAEGTWTRAMNELRERQRA